MGVQINGDTGNISATKADYSGNVTIGGTLTYEDVTNIDSVGLITAREGIEVGARPGVAASISVDGNAIFSGITTIGGNAKVGSGVTLSPDGNVFTTGITTVGGGLSMGDNVRANFGDGGDLQIYHSGAVDMVESTSTYLILEAPNTIIRNLAGDEAYAKFFGNGSVELYHNGTKQCETSANGLAFPSGKGIDFSAQTASSASGTSTSSELLDHYEEGTWTPTLTTSNGGAFSTNSSHAYGYYTRIGRIVHAHFVFNSYSDQYTDILGSGSSSDGVTGGGLPFPSANNSQEYYHGDIGFYALNFPGSLSLGTPSLYTYQGSNSSNFYFYLPNDNAASQLIQAQQFGQAYIRGCIHYLTSY